MLAILQSLGTFFIDLFKSRRRLEAENLFLGHQLSIALRRAPPRLRLRRWACHCGSDIMRNAKAFERNDALRPVTPGLIRIVPTGDNHGHAHSLSIAGHLCGRSVGSPPSVIRLMDPGLPLSK